MTILEQMRAIEAGLESWRTTHKAKVILCADPSETLALLLGPPGGFTAYVQFDSETPCDADQEASTFCTRHYLIVLTRGKGLKRDPGSGFVLGVAGGVPHFDAMEDLRDTVRGIDFTSAAETDEQPGNDELVLQYIGMRPWRGKGDLPLDATELEFSLTSRIPKLENETV